MALTDEQKREFDANGYVIVRYLLTDEEVDAVGQRADQIAVGEVTQPGFGVQVEPSIQRKEEARKIETGIHPQARRVGPQRSGHARARD